MTTLPSGDIRHPRGELTEQLDDSNPLTQVVETAWYNGKKY